METGQYSVQLNVWMVPGHFAWQCGPEELFTFEPPFLDTFRKREIHPSMKCNNYNHLNDGTHY